MNDLTTKTVSNPDLSQRSNDGQGTTPPTTTTVTVGRRKTIVTIAITIGIVLIAVISTVITTAIARGSKEIEKEITTTTATTTTATTTKFTIREITSPIIQTTTATDLINDNLVINGDAETGPCAESRAVMHPTGWNYIGTVTQISYSEATGGKSLAPTLAPNVRGRCFFYGQISPETSMWQIINLTDSFYPLITNQTFRFNFSAWIGGYQEQNDHALVSLTFLNKANDKLDNSTILEPVFTNDRKQETKLLFKNTTGFVPNDTYFMEIRVKFVREGGCDNDAYVDNIVLNLY